MTAKENRSIKRRRILHLGAIAGIGSLVPNAAAATSGESASSVNRGATPESPSEKGNGLSEKLSIRDGKVVVNPDASAAPVGSIGDTGYSIRDVAQTINVGVQQGHWKPVKVDGQILVKLTAAARLNLNKQLSNYGLLDARRPITQSACGETKFNNNGVWLNHEDTDTVAEALNDSGDVVMVAGVIFAVLGGVVGSPIGAIPGVIVAVAGYLINHFSGDLTLIDDGCGVKISNYYFVSWDVEPQSCSC